MPRDELDPPIDDDSGYRVRERDLAFLLIDHDSVMRWRQQGIPLGMSEIQYRGFVRDLADALREDGLSLTCDVRLKGSAAAFFSGRHKELPRTRDDLIDLFRELRRRPPRRWEVDEIIDRLTQRWISDGEFPKRRPFDSLYRLGVEGEPSDFDLQLSDDEIVRRCEQLLQDLRQPLSELRLKHETYNFVKKDLVRKPAQICIASLFARPTRCGGT